MLNPIGNHIKISRVLFCAYDTIFIALFLCAKGRLDPTEPSNPNHKKQFRGADDPAPE